MTKILTKYGALALAVALMVPLAQAQPAGMQAAFGKDAGTLSDKFTGLAGDPSERPTTLRTSLVRSD
jgi:hypothetical protein